MEKIPSGLEACVRVGIGRVEPSTCGRICDVSLTRMGVTGFRYDEDESDLLKGTDGTAETARDVSLGRTPAHFTAVVCEGRTRAVCGEKQFPKPRVQGRPVPITRQIGSSFIGFLHGCPSYSGP